MCAKCAVTRDIWSVDDVIQVSEEQCESKGRIGYAAWACLGSVGSHRGLGGTRWEVGGDRWWRTGNDLPSGRALCSLDLFSLSVT